MTFEEAMQLTRTVSSSTAFEDNECEAYFDILMSLPKDALIVEIGLEYGRSSSIALQVTQERGLRYYGIDPFMDTEDAYPRWFDMAKQTGAMYRLAVMHSHEAIIGESVHCILIDGDHSYDAVVDDCLHFLPRVVGDGYALFHDYSRDSLPEVYNAVHDYMDGNQHWRMDRVVGSLGIWRKY